MNRTHRSHLAGPNPRRRRNPPIPVRTGGDVDHELRRLVRATRRLVEVLTLIALLPLVACTVAVLASIVALVTGKVPS